MNALREAARKSGSWPFVEARRLLKRLDPSEDRPVVFQTGYGPSGLPHIGTFAEVARTSMVRRAFAELSDRPTRLICFSDDMDALRSVPENVPNPDLLEQALGLPLSRVPDPFGEHESFGAHNNARLRSFLDRFGFDYEFASSTERYRRGDFDETLMRVLERYEDILAIMLPTLGEERRRTYSPFLPISPKTGRVLQVPMISRDARRGVIAFHDEDGERVETPVTGGAVKLQWKPDWAMRWVALGVDYEMSGKDLIDSVRDSSRIARALGGRPPVGFSYEHFLDPEGRKISKSKGNGVAIERWLSYAPSTSLSYFMYGKPRTAKRLGLSTIPPVVDEYNRDLATYPSLSPELRIESPVWHVHSGAPPETGLPVSFRMLVNLAAVVGAEDGEELWEFLRRYEPGLEPETHPELSQAATHAARYFREVLRPQRKFRRPDEREAKALGALRDALARCGATAGAEEYQNAAYEVGKTSWSGDLRSWFDLLYHSLLGQESGPRFGGFVAVYGLADTLRLIDRAIAGEIAADAE